MRNGLLPLTYDEFYAHALLVERLAALRFRTAAARLRRIGCERIALELADMEREEVEQIRAIERGAAGRRLPLLCAAESAQHFNAAGFLPRQPEFPGDVLVVLWDGERQVESFYNRVAAAADIPGLRLLAAEMALDEASHVARLEALLKAADFVPRSPAPRPAVVGAAMAG
jgi:hypothetical protein